VEKFASVGCHRYYDFNIRHRVKSLTVPVTYRDFGSYSFRTDVTLERDVQKASGLRLGWNQKQIPDPTSDMVS